MKKILFATLAAITLMAAECNPDPIVSIFASGDGTSSNPYVIKTPEQLDAVRNNLAAYYKLGNDIDLTNYLAAGGAGFAQWGAEGWMPIGVKEFPFTGSLDGAGFTISGLVINRPSTNQMGLFGSAISSSFSNIGVENVNITGQNCVGGFVGVFEYGSITDCYTTGVVKGATFVGGMVGYLSFASAKVCYTSCEVNGNYSVGGFSGVAQYGSVANCFTSGAVSGKNNIGGISGDMLTASIVYCVALNPNIQTTVENTLSKIGRVVGEIIGGASSYTLTNNWAWRDMSVKFYDNTDKTLTEGSSTVDGADCDALPDPNWWKGVPSGVGWDDISWVFTTSQLPKLLWQL